MRSENESTRIVRSWLEDGSTALPDRVLDVVLAELPSVPQQRRLWSPRRNTRMSQFVKLAAGAAAVIAVVVVGVSVLPRDSSVGTPTSLPSASPSTLPSASASASPPGAFGGTVGYKTEDGAPATTVVDGVFDGATVSGTAVSTGPGGVHTVRLACASQDEDGWVLGGMVEETTIPGESEGGYSAVIVADGSPQGIAIWLSAGPDDFSDCEAMVASVGIGDLGGLLRPVETGELTFPPDLP